MGSKKLTKICIVFIAFLMVFLMNSNAFAAIQTSHIVKSGDTLFSISRQYDVSVETLKDLNKLTSSTIKVGQELKLTDDIIHTVKSGDTLFGISQQYNVSMDEIKKANRMTTTVVKLGQELKIPVGDGNSENNFVTTIGEGRIIYASQGGAKAYKMTSKTGGYYHQFVTGQTVIASYIGSYWYEGTIQDENGSSEKVYFHEDEVQGSSPLKMRIVYVSPGGAKAYKTTSKTGGYYKSYKIAESITVSYIGSYWYLGYINDSDGKKVTAFYHEDEVQGSKPTTTTTPPKQETKNVVTAVVKVNNNLNVRSGAGTNFGIIDWLYNGTKVEIIKESGSWANIKYNGSKTGWVSLDYLTNKAVVAVPVSESKPTKPAVQKATVKASGGLNVRIGAGTNYGIVGLLSNGTVVNVVKESSGWANIEYGKINGWVSKDYLTYGVTDDTSTPTGSLQGKVIVLDPGHGGNDSGAVGIDGTTYEKTLALGYSLDMKRELEAYGATVHMTRDTDTRCGGVWSATTNDDLRCRVSFANNKNADIFISVHFNSAYGATGTETYYNETNTLGNVNPHPRDSKLLAESVHKHYRTAVNLPDRKVKNANFYVNRMAKMPSILLEIGFLSSYNDLSRVKNASVQESVAKAVARGVDEYFSKKDN